MTEWAFVFECCHVLSFRFVRTIHVNHLTFSTAKEWRNKRADLIIAFNDFLTLWAYMRMFTAFIRWCVFAHFVSSFVVASRIEIDVLSMPVINV